MDCISCLMDKFRWPRNFQKDDKDTGPYSYGYWLEKMKIAEESYFSIIWIFCEHLIDNGILHG